MDPRKLFEAGEDTTIRADDNPEEAKERVLEVMAQALPQARAPSLQSRQPTTFTWEQVTDPRERQTVMERDRRRANVLSYLAQWLQAKGYNVRLEDGTDSVRVDVIATRESERILAELRPAIASLREADARAIAARRPVAAMEDHDERWVVLANNTAVEPAARRHLDVQGIAVYFVDPDVGTVARMDPATGDTEILPHRPHDLQR